MNNKTGIGIQHRKIGLLYWMLSCIAGSIIVTEIERFSFNQTPNFHIPLFMDGIISWLILSMISVVISFPAILIILYLSKNKPLQYFNKILSFSLVIFYILTFTLSYSLSASFWEALYLTCPYFALAFVFKTKYLRLLTTRIPQ